MNPQRILIAGVGNIFLGDDAFGVEAVRRLLQRSWAEGVRVVDFGIRGLDLTYALLEDYEAVILVDASPRGGEPGSLYVLELDPGEAPDPGAANLLIEAHTMTPDRVLRLAASLGSPVKRFFLVGCEPQTPVEAEELLMEMSDPVRAALDEVVPLIERLVARILAGECDSRPA
jgi:hydrogenase maturation protease